MRHNIIVTNQSIGINVGGSSSEADLFYNNVWNNTPVNYSDNVTNAGDISVDPMFVDPANGDFRLQSGSPCFDAGDPNGPLDIDGTRADLGAFPVYHYDQPWIWLLNYQLSDENGNGQVEAGETASLIVTLKNTNLVATNLSATLTSSDPDIQFIQATSNFGSLAQNDSTDNSDSPISFSVSPGASAHTDTLMLKLTADGGYQREFPIEMLIGSSDILLVDDDGGDSYQIWYIPWLNNAGIHYEVWDVAKKGCPQDNLQKYRAVIWFTGDCRDSTLTPNDQSAIAAYLDNGGCLLLTGQDIGYDLVEAGSADDSAFFANYLQADFVSDSANTDYVYGVNEDPITHGHNVYFKYIHGGAKNQTAPDEIAPIEPAISIFDYFPNQTSAGLRVENAATRSRVVYLAFGIEGIDGPNADTASKLLVKILGWFEMKTAVANPGLAAHPAATSYRLMQNYPNPFNPETIIQYQLPEAGQVTLKIYNLLGQQVRMLIEQSQPAGVYRQMWNGRDDSGKMVPAGIYFYHLKSGRFSKIKKMLLVQ